MPSYFAKNVGNFNSSSPKPFLGIFWWGLKLSCNHYLSGGVELIACHIFLVLHSTKVLLKKSCSGLLVNLKFCLSNFQFLEICALRVSANFEITVACGLKFHWYLKTLSLEFQTAEAEVFLSLPCWLS